MAVIAKLGPDLGAVGAAARSGKSAASQTLTDFSVKKGDNGGVLVCENYKSTAPEGRRTGAAYPSGGDYKENPFGPDDGAKAVAYVGSLLAKMTGGAMAPESPAEEASEPPMRPPMRRPLGPPPNPGVAVPPPPRPQY